MTETSTTLDAQYGDTERLVIATLRNKLKVYGRDAKELGTVDQFVVDMFSGKTEYAVLSFGGFLGLGQKYHPVPFAYLRVSTDGAGYIVDLDRTVIDGSPSYREDDAPVFDAGYGRRLKSYYAAGVVAPQPLST